MGFGRSSFEHFLQLYLRACAQQPRRSACGYVQAPLVHLRVSSQSFVATLSTFSRHKLAFFLGCLPAVDYGAGVLFNAAFTNGIAAPDAARRVSVTPSGAATFKAGQGRSAADCGMLACGIVAPRY